MKTLATALLVAAAQVYVATVHRSGELGFVNAGAGAAMVGAVADWFAVTAVPAPAGLPVPHTAVVPTHKDALGRSLQEFVATNSLAERVVRDRMAGSPMAHRVGGGCSTRPTPTGWPGR